jgi:hypothetical protein
VSGRRESPEVRALRVIQERRLAVTAVSHDDLLTARVEAICRGSEDVAYRLGFESGEWRCSCLGYQYRKRCKHLDALRLVVRVPRRAA